MFSFCIYQRGNEAGNRLFLSSYCSFSVIEILNIFYEEQMCANELAG